MIRTAERADYKAVKQLIDAGVTEGSLQPRRKKDIKQGIKKGLTSVAEEQGKIVGTVGIVVYDRRIAEIRSLYVSTPYRGNGVAHGLLRHVLQQPVSSLPSSTIFAITSTPRVFEREGFSTGIRSNTGERHIRMKNI